MGYVSITSGSGGVAHVTNRNIYSNSVCYIGNFKLNTTVPSNVHWTGVDKVGGKAGHAYLHHMGSGNPISISPSVQFIYYICVPFSLNTSPGFSISYNTIIYWNEKENTQNCLNKNGWTSQT